MNIPAHQLVDYFADAPLLFVDSYSHSITMDSNWTPSYTAADSCSFVLTSGGSAVVTIDGELYKLEPGFILHTPSKRKLNIQVITAWQYTVLNYRNLESNHQPFSLSEQSFVLYTGKQADLQQQLDALLNLYQQPAPITRLKAKASFFLVLQHMLQAAQQQARMKKSELMQQAVEFMHQHYHQPISVTEIAQVIGIERRRFAYLFERYTGMTPNHYMTSCRMKRSRELLRAQHYTVAQVAELVGYHDSFYFSRVFKKYNGMPPTDYRKQVSAHYSL